MVRPLQKRTEAGVLYTRPSRIEQSIAQTLTTDPGTWSARAAITDGHNPQYLAAEVLVHLVRHALRMQDHATANTVLERLGERCARLLKRRICETKAFNAQDVREETLSRLYELFPDDLKNWGEGLLDYYEVHFNSAFATLRNGVIREEISRAAPLEVLSESDIRDSEGKEIEPAELKDLSSGADVVLCAENQELYRLVQTLPSDERKAILLKYFFGLKTESTDHSEQTVASLCGVSGSEVRSRLRMAYARLKKLMEEKS